MNIFRKLCLVAFLLFFSSCPQLFAQSVDKYADTTIEAISLGNGIYMLILDDQVFKIGQITTLAVQSR